MAERRSIPVHHFIFFLVLHPQPRRRLHRNTDQTTPRPALPSLSRRPIFAAPPSQRLAVLAAARQQSHPLNPSLAVAQPLLTTQTPLVSRIQEDIPSQAVRGNGEVSSSDSNQPASMAPPPPDLLESPQPILDEISEEILLRLPPDDPSCLVRAAAVCKRWRRLVAHPNFLRRLHELHQGPRPLLGLFLSDYIKRSTGRLDYVPTTPSAFSLPIPDSRGWKVLNYRHGRVLFSSQVTEEGQDFLIWEPITGDQRLVPVPGAPKSMLMDAAVVCAADGCDHRDCHGGPFRLVFLYIVSNVNLTFVRAYSSESGSWGKVYAVVYEPVKENSSVLVGQSRIYFLSGFDRILEYDWTRQPCLSVIDLPDTLAALKGIIGLVLTRERELGVAGVKEACLYLWSREASDKGEFQSTIRIIELHNMLPAAALSASERVDVLGFAEDANVIFLNTNAGVFAIDLEPERATKVCETHKSCRPLIPFSSFYIPGKRVAAAGGGEGTS